MKEKKRLSLEDVELDFDIEELLADIERCEQLKKLRKEHSYVADLVRLLLPRAVGLSRQMVLHELEATTTERWFTYSGEIREGSAKQL